MAQSEVNYTNTQIWDTSTVSSTDAFDFYREGLCTAFMPLRPELSLEERGAFRAKVRSHQLTGGVLNLVFADAHPVFRGKSEISSSPLDCFYLNLQISGQCAVSQKDTTITPKAGDVYIFDSSKSFEMQHLDCASVGVASLVIPKINLPGVNLEEPNFLSQHPIYGDLLIECIRTLAQSANTAANVDLDHLTKVIQGLVPLASQTSLHPRDQTSQSSAQFLRIRRVLRQNCANPDFGIGQCSKFTSLSRGYIHQICASQGQRFGKMLLDERLRLVKLYLLSAERQHSPVSSAAYDAGFTDLSHFGRVFREKFGQTPGAWRRSKQMP
ncbi:AraC family transcriptional regulator [uncultured Sulfitobacter sp.]|uniref:AraC family transcriptional regulator n=1 Tax=uncultured Sulfitobacter sp. TaxID=191468 RepID=UPI0030F5F0E6